MSSKPKRATKRETVGRVPGSRKPKQNSDRLQLKVGEKWMGGLDAKTEPVVKVRVITGIVGFCGALITAITVQALVQGNSSRLDQVFGISWKALCLFSLWAMTPHWKKAWGAIAKAIKVWPNMRE